jgi:uncharacterized protein YutE (UPF0331/DUF86 family)
VTLPAGQPHEGLRRIAEYTGYLRELAKAPREALVGDFVRLGSAKYYLLVAIEAAIDLARHLTVIRGWREPKNYADTFVVLGERGVVPEDFLPALRDMTRFRNRLVHMYWDIDSGTLHQLLQTRLSDSDRLSQLLLAALDEPDLPQRTND